MLLSNLSIKRPVFATVMMLSLVTLGLFSYKQLAIDMYPDVEIPVISITTKYPGASPETVEREVTKRIEEAVNPISGVKHVISYSRESVSIVVVEFRLEIKVNEASQEARSKITAIRGDLPQEIEEPIVQKIDFSAMPVISLGVRSESLNPKDLSTLVEKKVKRRLESISGVGKVELVGLSKREVNIDIDPSRLEALGMGINQVISGLQSENVNTPLGRLNQKGSEYPIRLAGKPDVVDKFKNMVISQSNGRGIKLPEISQIIDGVEEQRSLALVNGIPAIGINILKQSGANTVGVVDSVKKAIEKIQIELPKGTDLEMVRDGSIMIRESVENVKKTLIEGGILTIFIVFLFLNSWRSTVITGLTLPISVISSFIIMNAMHMTLNVMTLMALSLAIGLLIDDAIVVRENIVRHLEHGKDHFQAASDGTSEIGLAVLATTFSIVAVFVPVAYMKGIVGRFFFQFGMTVAFAILISLLVSFTLDPMLSSRWYDPDIERKGKRHIVARLLDHFNNGFDHTADSYRGVIAWSLDHRKTIMAFAGIAFFMGLFTFSKLPSTFFQEQDMSEFQITFKTAPDASIDETRGRVNAILNLLKTVPEIKHTFSTIGAGDSGTVRDALIYIKLEDKEDRKRTQFQIQNEIRKKLEEISGILPNIIEAGRLHGQKTIELSLRGEEIELLKKYSAEIKKRLYKIKGIVDLEVSMENDIPELHIIVDQERATDAGIMTHQIVQTVGAMIGGQVATTYEDEDGDAVDVRVRLPKELRQNPDHIQKLYLSVSKPFSQPTLIPLKELINFKMSATPSEINRRDLNREVLISSNLAGIDMGSAMEEIKKIASEIKMEPGYKVVFSGEAEDMVESFGYMADALLLAIIFVYLILAAQFESFIDPLAIMFSLPLSIVGMAAMLYMTGDSISIMSLIGLIMLMGLVTKNAILLVDYSKVLISRGNNRRNAIINAGRTRLRPIMMTTLAMIFGMVPLALGIGAGAEMRAPMARAVIGGLITSTLLTLLVVPVMFTILDDFQKWMKKKWTGNSLISSLIVIVLLLAVINKPAEAADTNNLTLQDVLVMAAKENKDIKKALEYRKKVEGIYIEERSAALPHLSLIANAASQRDELTHKVSSFTPAQQNSYGSKINLTQALFTWGQVGAAIRAAKIGIKTADDQFNLYRQTVARDVSIAFYDVLMAKELVYINKENYEQKNRHLDEAKRKYLAGIATDYDVLAAEVARENAKPEVIHSDNLQEISLERLGLLIGLEAKTFNIKGSLETSQSDLPDFNEILSSALANRPELSDLNHRKGMQKEIVSVAKAANKPRLDLNAFYGWGDVRLGDGHAQGDNSSVAVIMSFPFFDGFKTTGLVAQIESSVSSLNLEQEKLKDSIKLQVYESLNALKESNETVKALTKTVSMAEKLLDMAEKGFIYGVKTNLDVQDALLNLKLAKGNLTKAKRDYIASKVNLEWVKGTIVLP